MRSAKHLPPSDLALLLKLEKLDIEQTRKALEVTRIKMKPHRSVSHSRVRGLPQPQDPMLRPEFALHKAARDGDTVHLKSLLRNREHDLEIYCYDFGTALHTAIRFNHAECVRLLLDEGADPEALADGLSSRTDSALTLASRVGVSLEIVNTLWELGVARLGNPHEGEKRSVLEIAAMHGNDEIVRAYLRLWATWPPKVREEALRLATERWEVECVRGLLEGSGSEFSKKVLGQTLLKACGDMFQLDIERLVYDDAAMKRQGDIVEMLIDHGADMNFQGPKGQAPVHVASSRTTRLGSLKVLVRRGADLELKDDYGRTAISFAARECLPLQPYVGCDMIRQFDAIKILLEAGALPLSKEGNTPLFTIAFEGDLELFKTCISKDCCAGWIETYGERLLEEAVTGGRLEMSRFLLESGVKETPSTLTKWPVIVRAVSSAINGPVFDIVKLLIEFGANPMDRLPHTGWTALHRVADLRIPDQEIEDFVHYLVAAGAAPNAKAASYREYGTRRRGTITPKTLLRALNFVWETDPGEYVNDQTPLHWAAENGNLAMIKALLGSGANAKARDSRDADAALVAAAVAKREVDKDPKVNGLQIQVIKALLEAGADYHHKDCDGNSLSIWATEAGLTADWRSRDVPL